LKETRKSAATGKIMIPAVLLIIRFIKFIKLGFS
jgi:hypothetical protein